jgi:thiamine biosynthesis lipoprotein
LLALLPGALQAQDVQRFEQHYDDVLGTTLDLTLYGPDPAALASAADAALAEIKRLDAIISSQRSDSEVMRLNRERLINGASPELLEIIELCTKWEGLAPQRFSCKLGRVISAWNQAEQTQTLPDRIKLQMLATTIAAAPAPTFYRGSSTITLTEPVELDFSGIATGYVIDHAFYLLRKSAPDATGIKVDIGGDALYWGQPPLSDGTGWRVDVANPMTNSDTIATLSTINGRAITSRHANRFRTINGEQFSTVLDPATGWPVRNDIGLVTVARAAVDTDAATTAMTLQTVAQAVAWASAVPDLDVLALDAGGNQLTSDAWMDFVAKAIVEDSDSVLSLNYTLPTIQTTGPYSRPYVAIWVTDAQQALRKNLLLLGEDQRWARENTRWWRQVGRQNPKLIDGTARPTRAPGEYRLAWDGLDEAGKRLPAGDYVLHVEAARQDGGHDYQALPFTPGSVKTLELPGEGEIGKLVLEVK